MSHLIPLAVIALLVIIAVAACVADWKTASSTMAQNSGHQFKPWTRQPSRCLVCGKRQRNLRHQVATI